MSETTEHQAHAPHGPELRLDKVGPAGLLVGVVCLVAVLVGMFAGNRDGVLQSYLFGWTFWAFVGIGAFALTLLHHVVRGSWGTSVLRMFEAGGGAAAILTFAVLFIPIAVGSHSLYHWMHAEAVAEDLVLQHKQPWLNPTAWIIRAVLFFALWAALAWGLRQSSLREEKSLDAKETQRRTNWAAPGIVMLVLTLTFAVTDWVMSLDPHWFSTIMPVCFLVSGGLGALSLAVFVVCRYANSAPFHEVISPSLTRDLGNMMLALTMFWSYITMSQYLIIWSGNLPEFTTFFVHRGNHGWEWVGNSLILLGFFIPFLMLLSPTTKAKPHLLARVAIFTFVVRIIECYWYVIPFFHDRTHSVLPTVWDVLAWVGVGGIFLAVFASQIRKAPLLPAYDQRLKEMAQHAH